MMGLDNRTGKGGQNHAVYRITQQKINVPYKSIYQPQNGFVSHQIAWASMSRAIQRCASRCSSLPEIENATRREGLERSTENKVRSV